MSYTATSSANEYNAVAKFLHWSIALLIIANYIIGLTLDSNSWYTLHKQMGLTILLLALIRIIWRLCSKFPEPLAEISVIEDVAAKSGQFVLYLLMISIPLIGIYLVQGHGYSLQLWGVIPLPTLLSKQSHEFTHLLKEYHLWLAHAVITIAAVHGLIACYHHFVKKNRLLSRMLPFKNK